MDDNELITEDQLHALISCSEDINAPEESGLTILYKLIQNNQTELVKNPT